MQLRLNILHLIKNQQMQYREKVGPKNHPKKMSNKSYFDKDNDAAWRGEKYGEFGGSANSGVNRSD
jgi:hypothetical protein